VWRSKRKKEERGRYTARRKAEAVVPLLKGEDLDTLSRELGVTAATLSEWRDAFLAVAKANLKNHEPTPADDENMRLQARGGELTMSLEVVREKAVPRPWLGPSRQLQASAQAVASSWQALLRYRRALSQTVPSGQVQPYAGQSEALVHAAPLPPPLLPPSPPAPATPRWPWQVVAHVCAWPWHAPLRHTREVFQTEPSAQLQA
jgi:transposase-like protein